MPSFLSNLADKAQSAINASPLAGHIPPISGSNAGPGTHGTEHPTANEAAAQGGIGAKSHTLGNLQHQLRSLQMQYTSATPVQKIITSQKGVALDCDSLSRDVKGQSKELYVWGQSEDADIKDVTDRLAYLNFVHGSLSEKLAINIDASRTPFKTLRDAENKLTPRRNIRAGIQNQISRLEHDQQKGYEGRVHELKQQLQKAEGEDNAAEKEYELLKRKAIRESEQAKWAALREYAEKVVLLAEASTSIIGALPTLPPTSSQPYSGAQSTAATRASLQRALDNYKPGSLSHSFQPSAADLNRSDSRSFGVTHASELSSMPSVATPSISNLPVTPPAEQTHQDTASIPKVGTESHSINPAALNQTPSPIPAASPGAVKSAGSIPHPEGIPHADGGIPQAEGATSLASQPTVAETGIPVSAGAQGPGPASGSLHDLKSGTTPSTSGAAGLSQGKDQIPGYGVGVGAPLAAEDEKKRLEREERERVLRAGAPTQATSYQAPAGPPPGVESTQAPKHETAGEEKSRLEREERERLLKEAAGEGGNSSKDADQATPPPYQDF